MSARVFLDTSVLVYAFVQGDAHQQRSLKILSDGGLISVQVLNELATVCSKKLCMNWTEMEAALESIRLCCPPAIALTLGLHEEAVRIGRRYGYSIYDGLILAAALEARCTTLYTEDLQHGQLIEGLRIENPFQSAFCC